MNITTIHKIINGDSRQMSELEDKSVHLIVTSPPYWQLKDYGSENQIGFHDDYETYINHLNIVWQECYRVLHDGCRLCINIGDQFARSTYYGRYKIIPIHTEIIKFCEAIGFDFMGQIVWQKTTTMNTSGGASIMGSFPYPRNGIVKLDFEYILLFKKQGKSPQPTKEQKENSAMTNEEWNTYFNGHWYFSGVKQDKHLAMFPEELPYRLIRMFSFPNETVLDPFMGSGTTAAVAKKLYRNSIGYEINSEFIPIIEEKIGGSDVFSKIKTEFIQQKPILQGFEKEIKKLPYQFIDTHKLNKKIDIKKIQYGSKIDAESVGKREEFFFVKEIISPELIKLNNDLIIRLIGIKQNLNVNKEAIDFLYKKLKGKKVFLKYDEIKHDSENHLMAYLYLKNKTFINAHLLKEKLAMVDNSISFKYKNKFLNL
ncbi:DNA modification methylase [Dysgonomonas sp. PH5-45]|uniref:DNA methyltransferase n=1 Tax=unclassified Dysgonomonas TaxID=2630389 RepID=UPI002477080B|nr:MULTISPECIES: DNA methyltransferase [unclassified Dysgonomonas]MDH6355696.1 DNA modification methylase [Dysgonomonas sp. PH5-45]MDH6388593.1 DNA modification methylase [Dysgonomonas sp. PH5-37]